VYLRKANESIEVFDCEISSNENEAFYAFTPFRELNQYNVSEILYMINKTKIVENGRGIFQVSILSLVMLPRSWHKIKTHLPRLISTTCVEIDSG
jgi:hypothetical protein